MMISRSDFLGLVNQRMKNWKIRKKKNKEYFDIPCAFDTETSSFLDSDGNKTALCYVWQFGIDDIVTYGRTLAEFSVFIQQLKQVMGLSHERILCSFVHNLTYDYQFIRKWFQWDKVFFFKQRVPLYAETGGMEFRDSLKLSGGRALREVGKKLRSPVLKADGDLDYQLVRHEYTPLSEKELYYCEQDIRILLQYIREKIEDDSGITRIPLTNTGYVRNAFRTNCLYKNKFYKKFIHEMNLTVDSYKVLESAFAGGATHANHRQVGKTIESVWSFDLTSSYPAVMSYEKFPMESFHKYNGLVTPDIFKQFIKDYCCVLKLKFTMIVPKVDTEHPLSYSKCKYVENPIKDNGRIVSASSLETTITEQDFLTLCDFYHWDDLEVLELWYAKKERLPRPFVQTLLDFYQKKTELKGVKGQELYYMISKNMTNSSYGMTVQKVLRDMFEIDDSLEGYSLVQPDVEKMIDKDNKNRKRFLYYGWGVWVTAHARRRLYRLILENGDNHVYSDTDSEKCTPSVANLMWIKKDNMEVQRKIEQASKELNLPIEMFIPTDRKGKKHPIGYWDFEGVYKRFKTLGAKRYLVETETGEIIATVAGINKKSFSKWLSGLPEPFEAFKLGLAVPEDVAQRKFCEMVDEVRTGTVIDYLGNKASYTSLSGVHMENTVYELNNVAEFVDWLKIIVEIEGEINV